MILIGNGTVITRDVDNPYIENGAVCVEDNVIKEIGPLDYLRETYDMAEWVDAKGGLIMPGLINVHDHCYSAMARGLSIPGNSPTNFLEILENTWWNIDRKLTLKQVYYSAITTYMDCIKNGVTCVFDHHASYGSIKGSLYKISNAAKHLGIRTCLSYEISDRDGIGNRNQAVDENMEFIAYLQQENSELQKAMIGLHASFTLSEETLKYCVSQNIHKAGYHIHVAEDYSDFAHCHNTYHCSIVERLHKAGILGEKTIASHCIYITKEDMELLKATNTCVVHNPESNMGNAVGCADILTMYQKGLLLGLGTDGYTSDMLESMKVANLLQKHHSKNPSVAWSEVPHMLFQNNRKIAERFYEKALGVLKEGAYADIIILEYNSPTPMNKENIDSHLLFGVNGKDTITTIINGKIVMKDRRLLNIAEEDLLEQCRIEAENLWMKLTKK